MKARILLPKTKLRETDSRGHRRRSGFPLFFLAGPILGGGDWHSRMTEMLAERVGVCFIVNPSRYTPDHPHYQYKLPGEEDAFPNQTLWERYYIEEAATGMRGSHGCLIFWLATESKESPRTDGKPYAMDTRGEIGEWRGRFMHYERLRLPVRIVMGADPDFPGLRTIQRNNDAATRCLPIHQSMEAVVEKAARLAETTSGDYTKIMAETE